MSEVNIPFLFSENVDLIFSTYNGFEEVIAFEGQCWLHLLIVPSNGNLFYIYHNASFQARVALNFFGYQMSSKLIDCITQKKSCCGLIFRLTVASLKGQKESFTLVSSP